MIEEDYAGKIRNGGVRITGANFVSPIANKVSDLLDVLIDFCKYKSVRFK